MVLADIVRMLSCEVFAGDEALDRAVSFGCASDLMSDVLAFSRTGSLLLTGLVNVQTVQTAHIAELNAIIFVRGKKPDEGVIALARGKGIPLLGTPYSMYEACGILYRAGIPSTMGCADALASS
ncbi:MAG TPA: DRTGG domain-containing protein [Bacteroidota bacterium]|nr:DRTGG domain-containing protein [Bacteroidota bacterium]